MKWFEPILAKYGYYKHGTICDVDILKWTLRDKLVKYEDNYSLVIDVILSTCINFTVDNVVEILEYSKGINSDIDDYLNQQIELEKLYDSI